eukprot:8496410-Ditylum_brightwellii.AAC.1
MDDINGNGNTTFVHFDIDATNVVAAGKILKLNDFNIGILFCFVLMINFNSIHDMNQVMYL